MPHAKPESSFEAAARHLFRHITDVNALRDNPLVFSFIASAKKRGAGAILADIHTRVLAEAEAICKTLAAEGSPLRASRRQTIVAAICAGESAAETAGRLGVSMTHYYRERQAICTSVARALVQETAARTSDAQTSDPLRLLFARADSLMDRGCSHKAANVLEEACANLPRGPAQAAVLVELAYVLTEAGPETRAAELLAQSRMLGERHAPERADEWLDDRHALTQARLEIHIRSDAGSGSALEVLAKRSITDRRADDVALDTFLACGDWYWQTGRFGQARKMLQHARAVDRKLPHTSALQQIAIALLAGDCTQDSVDTFDMQHRWFAEALALSISNGSSLKTIRAMQGLMSCAVSTSRDDDVYHYAKECLTIAQSTDCQLTLLYAALNAIGSLLRTQHWRAADPLLFEVEKLVQPGSFLWGELKHLQGSFWARVGRYDRAQGPLWEAYGVATNLGNRQFEAVLVRDLAVALHRTGSASDGIEMLRQAIELAESNGTAYSLWATYEVAARMLGDRRLLRLAGRARAAMLACREALRESTDPVRTGSAVFHPRLSLGTPAESTRSR